MLTMLRIRAIQRTILIITIALVAGVCKAANDRLPVGTVVETDAAGKSQDTATKSVLRVLCTTSRLGGTGFVHRSGRVLTAQHIIDGCSPEAVILLTSAGKRILAEAVVGSASLDLAVITPKQPITAPAFPIAEAQSLSIGSQITAWGYPAGYQGSDPLLVVGYVAGVDKPDKEMPEQWIVNAAFNSGNSGGPVLNLEDGAVVGVVSSKLAPLPREIESSLEALAKMRSGMAYERTYPDGHKETVVEARVIADVLYYLRSQTQLVLGYAVKSSDVRRFLKEQGIDP